MVLAVGRLGGQSDVATSTSTEASRVGEAWLTAIAAGDRDAFATLHADDLVVDDTVIGFSEDVGILTPDRLSELYLDGFDSLQAAVEIDDDVLRLDGCRDTGPDRVRCAFTATMIGPASPGVIGPDDYTYTVTADLVVEDRLIRSIDFSTATNPADFRSVIDGFVDREANDEDLACMAIGFNTAGCGRHESDFIPPLCRLLRGGPGVGRPLGDTNRQPRGPRAPGLTRGRS